MYIDTGHTHQDQQAGEAATRWPDLQLQGLISALMYTAQLTLPDKLLHRVKILKETLASGPNWFLC